MYNNGKWYLDGIECDNTEVFTLENIDNFGKALNQGCSPGRWSYKYEYL